MSQQRNVDVNCPECGHPGTFEVWDSVNVGLDSEMREKVLSGDIFTWTCPHCGHVVISPYSFIYHDMEHKFMLFFDPDEPENGKKYDPMKIEFPFHAMDDYTFRPVCGFLNLREKIIIFEHGFNDIAIERVKYFFKHFIDPDELHDAEFFSFIDRVLPCEENNMEDELVFIYKNPRMEKPSVFTARKELYDHALEAINLDPRFNNTGIHCIDEEWIGMKLKGVE